MFKKLIAVVSVIYFIVGYATEYDESFYIAPKLDFVNQLDSEDSSDFGLGYALDIGVPIHKFISIENTIRYIDWNSDQFESNFLQYGTLLKLNYPFTEKTNFALSGGFLADLDVGSEVRDKEVNPYVKLDVDYHINNNWVVVLGFNQSFSSDYLDQYAYSLGVKYKFYKEKPAVEPQSVCDCIFSKEKLEEAIKPVPEKKKVVGAIIKDELESRYFSSKEMKSTFDYTIKKGDYIYKICRKFNITLDEFIHMNKAYFSGRDLDYVYPGETVKVKTK
ncbi:TPA: LysM peptidoglycan-binding domain-containing protein [Vibrio parahaemolyticus]|uniref:LysM peptidoglycan-binding domain-containing protein n=1 Tax=Vibrio parahaemolyticus TaxID=670 RepID=UPI0023629D82|nr:LysM peptidoglycan-binding domain-containing protein [Vibrio parahaemolyticus]HCM1332346.1 LysM peptidoglycan-binding domain-containing protein [Vibrio parahaemolyticus]